MHRRDRFSRGRPRRPETLERDDAAADAAPTEPAIWFVTNDAHEIFLIHRHQGVWAEAA